MPGEDGVSLRGQKYFLNKLARLRGNAVKDAARRTLYAGAEMIRAEAFQSISRGSISGKKHVPSAPGEPPNRDTGTLQNHIETTMPGPLLAEVRSNAEYAAALELGTSKMAARPYLRPARDKMRRKIQNLFARELIQMMNRL